jgi:CRISPR/Cas system-associated exonuclease Cas4 (RecB family)
MKVGIEVKDKDIYSIVSMLNSHNGVEIKLDEVLLELVNKNISSSDFLFLILQKLEEGDFVKGSKGILKIEKEIAESEMKKILMELIDELSKSRKLFVTPLEVGKFFQCARRIFLEKLVLSKQFKEERGKTWDGETIHHAINLFIKNLNKNPTDKQIEEFVKESIKKYKDMVTIDEGSVKEFIFKFKELVEEENFKHIFTETMFQSLKIGLVGTPDIVGIKENGEIVPIDVKLGLLSDRGVKEEHLMQSVGEALLLEDFFRKKVDYSLIIYYGSNSLAKIDLDDAMKRKFINLKRSIEKMCKNEYVPEMSNLPNFRKRSCVGCHVKPACDNLEEIKTIE